MTPPLALPWRTGTVVCCAHPLLPVCYRMVLIFMHLRFFRKLRGVSHSVNLMSLN